ncbi:MAG: hypothetical protein M1830_008040 [Pleopsidium flavum]|nr:MAG: hypothetical protein M1830_008040 [Pleopsidium flavum]
MDDNQDHALLNAPSAIFRKAMKRDASHLSVEEPPIKCRHWDDAPPTSLVAPISPPHLDTKTISDRLRPQSNTEKRGKQQSTASSPTLAAIEAGEAQIRDHLAYFSKHLGKVTKPCSPPAPQLSNIDFVKLYKRNGNTHGHHFVIHQHDHPVAGVHYDLRLQFSESSSISFAIMYGLPGNPDSLRMGRNATETRVHNLWNHLIESASHATGSLLIWDTGEYSVLPSKKNRPEASEFSSDPDDKSNDVEQTTTENEKLNQAFRAGKIRLRLHGTRLPKNYTIILRLTGLNYRSNQPTNPVRKRQRQRKDTNTRPTARQETPPPSDTERTEATPDNDAVSPSRDSSDEKISALEMEIAEHEDQQTRLTNAYPGANNTICSIHQRSWHLSLDKPSSGFVRQVDGNGKRSWQRRWEDGVLLGFETFFVRGRDFEKSVVTGRLADEVLVDEGVEGFRMRKGWRAVME